MRDFMTFIAALAIGIAGALILALTIMGGRVLFAPDSPPHHTAAAAAQEALGKALAAPDLPTARKHSLAARGHLRDLLQDMEGCS